MLRNEKQFQELLFAVVKINYNIAEKNMFSREDRQHMEIVEKCADLYAELMQIHEERDKSELEEYTHITDWNLEKDDDLYGEDWSTYFEKNNINNNVDDKPETLKANECKSIIIVDEQSIPIDKIVDITYENNSELMEIYKKQELVFLELTKNHLESLNNVQTGFWKTVEIT